MIERKSETWNLLEPPSLLQKEIFGSITMTTWWIISHFGCGLDPLRKRNPYLQTYL